MRTRIRDQWPTLLVAALAGTFGVALLHVTGLLGAAIAADEVTGESATVTLILGIVASVFIVIAVYVSAIVTANTVATVVAGRTRLIALLRLIGSSARSQRAQIAKEGLLVGLVGAVIGVGAGTGAAMLLEQVAVATDLMAPWMAPIATAVRSSQSGMVKSAEDTAPVNHLRHPHDA